MALDKLILKEYDWISVTWPMPPEAPQTTMAWLVLSY